MSRCRCSLDRFGTSTCEKWHLKEALLVPEISPEHINENIGLAAAQYMERFLHEKQLIGLGWGSTISWMTRNITIPHDQRPHSSPLWRSNYLPEYTNCGKVCRLYSLDFVILSTSYRHHLLSTQGKSGTCSWKSLKYSECYKWHLPDLSFVGIGALEPSNSFSQFGYRSKEDLELLTRLGAVGEIHGEHFDAEGQSLELEQHDRLIATRLSDLRKMKRVGVSLEENEK